MFFSEKEKGLNNNYRRSGGASKRIIHYMKKKNPFSHTNAFKSNIFEFAGKTETR